MHYFYFIFEITKYVSCAFLFCNQVVGTSIFQLSNPNEITWSEMTNFNLYDKKAKVCGEKHLEEYNNRQEISREKIIS